MKKKTNNYFLGFLVVSSIFFYQYADSLPFKKSLDENDTPVYIPKKITVENKSSIAGKKPRLPVFFKKVILEDIPFYVQAPFANWKVHKESCEEASVLMVHSFQEREKINMKEVDHILRKMKEFQEEKTGKEIDLYDYELMEFIKEFYNYKKINLYFNVSIERLKQKIAQGIPVIVPVTAGKLNNPFYKYSGYHVLVAIGYDDYSKKMITNDPGTKRGRKYTYPYSLFEIAMKDAGNFMITIEDNPMP